MEPPVPPSSNPRGSVVLETPGHCLPMPAVALPAAWPCLPHARGSTRHQNGLGFLSLSALLLWTPASRRDADRTVSDSVSRRGVLPGPDRNLCQGSFSLKQSSFSCGARAHRSDHHQLPTQQQQTYFCGRVWLTTSAPRTAEIVGSKDFCLQGAAGHRQLPLCTPRSGISCWTPPRRADVSAASAISHWHCTQSSPTG